MTQALEQMLELVPAMGQDRLYGTIDQYAGGTTVLYSFDPPKPLAPFFPVGGGNDIGINVPLPEITPIRDYHEILKIDRYGNTFDPPYGGGLGDNHSTIIPELGDPLHIPHRKLPY